MEEKTKENNITDETIDSNKEVVSELMDEFKSKMANAILNHYEKIEKKYSFKELSWGYPTKFNEYDELTGGLHNSELTIVAARHSMGKTSFVLNMLLSLLEQNIPVLFISYEMNYDVICSRLLSTHSEIDSQLFKSGNLKPQEFEKLIQSMTFLAESAETELLNVIPECTYRYKELSDEIKKFKEKHSSGVIFIDYFQLIELTKDEDRYSELTNMAASFKRLVMEIDLPIVLVSQVSKKREGENNKRPRLSDLAECDALAQHCDNLVFIYREDYYEAEKSLLDTGYEFALNPETRNIAEIIVAKHKNGPTKTCKLLFQSTITKFKNKVKVDLF